MNHLELLTLRNSTQFYSVSSGTRTIVSEKSIIRLKEVAKKPSISIQQALLGGKTTRLKLRAMPLEIDIVVERGRMVLNTRLGFYCVNNGKLMFCMIPVFGLSAVIQTQKFGPEHKDPMCWEVMAETVQPWALLNKCVGVCFWFIYYHSFERNIGRVTLMSFDWK